MVKETLAQDRNMKLTAEEKALNLLDEFKKNFKLEVNYLDNRLLGDIWNVFNETKDLPLERRKKSGMDRKEMDNFGLEAVEFARIKIKLSKGSKEISREKRYAMLEALEYMKGCVCAFENFMLPLREFFTCFLKLGGVCGANDVVILEAIMFLKEKKRDFEAEKCRKVYKSVLDASSNPGISKIAEKVFFKSEKDKYLEDFIFFKECCFGNFSQEAMASLFCDLCIKYRGDKESVKKLVQVMENSNRNSLANDCRNFFQNIRKSAKFRNFGGR